MLKSPLDCKIKPVNSKENHSWIFIGRTDADAESEAPILWPPDAKSWLIRNDPDAGKDWRQEEKGVTDDEMVGWHHWFNGHEFEQAPGDGEGQGSLCSAVHGVTKNWIGFSNCTTIKSLILHAEDNMQPSWFYFWNAISKINIINHNNIKGN